MKKAKVALYQQPRGFVTVENGATAGATFGVDLKWPDGTLVKESDFSGSAPAQTGVQQTLWSLVLQIPATVQALAAATGTGFYSSAGVFRTFQNTTTITWTNPDGVSGAPSATFSGTTDDVTEGSTNKYFTDERAMDAIAAMIAAGTQTGITITYNDAGNSMSFTVAGGGGGGGVSSGTSNPGSPSAGDLFFRTDLGIFIYYDGARWLTVNEYCFSPGGSQDHLGNSASNPSVQARWPVRSDFQIYLTRWSTTTLVVGTNDGSNYWTITLNRTDTGNTQTAITSFNTSADTATNWVQHDQSINAALNATAKQIQTTATKTGGAGGLYAPTTIHYRLIVT